MMFASVPLSTTHTEGVQMSKPSIFETAVPAELVKPPEQPGAVIAHAAGAASSRDADEPDTAPRFTLPFSFALEDWQFLFGAVRDGDYWSAARYAVRILNGILNPEAKVKALRPLTLTEDESATLARQIAFVQSKCAELASAPEPAAVRTSVSGAPEFGIADVIAIIQILAPIIERWRGKRKKG